MLANWSITRVIRLILALFCAHGSYDGNDILMGIVALVLFYQVVTKTGCDGQSCEK